MYMLPMRNQQRNKKYFYTLYTLLHIKILNWFEFMDPIDFLPDDH